jgi:hypothetical protein
MNVDKNQATRSPGEAQLQSTQRAATAPLLVSFVAGNTGAWRIDRITPVAGDGLTGAPRLNVIEGGNAMNGSTAAWTLRESTSNISPASAAPDYQENTARPYDGLQVACELVLEGNVVTTSVVMNEMRRLIASSQPTMLDVPELLKLQLEPLADCGR